MNDKGDFSLNCPVPISDYAEIILAHGGGGALTRQLIESTFLPAFSNPILDALHDSAILDLNGVKLAFTTDSYVVRPCFFPGGDIGSLAVSGTVNDLVMCGAKPLYLTLAFILEEGFSMRDLRRIVESIKVQADRAGVKLVTGDTKVVDKGSGDGIYINTSGIGIIEGSNVISPQRVRPGDSVIISGDVGRHGIAVMAMRESLELEKPIQSDVASLDRPVLSLVEAGVDVHCLRDPTRGGLATTLIEIAEQANVEVCIEETSVPVSDEVRGVCEILGFDPLYIACEGRFVAFVPEDEKERTLDILRRDPLCSQARVIGTVCEAKSGIVTCKTSIGGTRVLDMLSGEQLPRIC
ncbi:MAG: hydrogenase expression/formation protein HypE [Candidatus Hydrogenedentota bacterium]|nr:MAG: hydrogenase expression/formation protein HypE [Candidatus Hydrogenedentota bacterium]